MDKQSCISRYLIFKYYINGYFLKYLISLIGLIIFLSFTNAENISQGVVLVTKVNGPIGPATSDHVLLSIEKATNLDAKLLIIELDTPGGLDTAMRDIIQGIISSPVPIATYVSPSGSRAASAGTYILYASHIAAMAPATTLGAATPVQIGGMPKFPGSPDTSKENKNEEELSSKKDAADDQSRISTAEKKVVNDAAAYIRALAQLRHRNMEWGEDAVRKASSLSSEEALEHDVIDYIATDIPDLLDKLHGQTISVMGVLYQLATRNTILVYHEPDWRNKLLTVITDPNILPILMTLGMLGLIYEMLNPGFVLPGVLGGISILLALYAAQVLPINYAGLALIILGILFIIGEVFVPSFGALGIGGIIAFVIGSIILIDTEYEGYSVSILFISTFAIINALFLFFILALILKSRRKPIVSGGEELIGTSGKITAIEDNEMWATVHGESWKATSRQTINTGENIRVIGLEGLTLIVEAENPKTEN
jgi:membrane-bound serine protease (ClpP class)